MKTSVVEIWVSAGMQEHLLGTPVSYLSPGCNRAPVRIEKMLISAKMNNVRVWN